MGKLNLGLDDRSARLIHGRDVWTEIRGLLSGYSAISAAIAFVGPDADQHLPLRGPATIVVNAGDNALASGWTDPEVLLRWTRRGVRVYSLASLHAKVLLRRDIPHLFSSARPTCSRRPGGFWTKRFWSRTNARQSTNCGTRSPAGAAGPASRSPKPGCRRPGPGIARRPRIDCPSHMRLRPSSTRARFRMDELDKALFDSAPAAPTVRPAMTSQIQDVPVEPEGGCPGGTGC